MKQKEFTLRHPLGFTISKSLTEREISSVFHFQKDDMGNGYVWYRIPKTEILGKSLNFSLCFHDGILEFVSFCVVVPELYNKSWDDWSEEKEKLCAKHTGDWLVSNGYKIGKFSWGEIWVGYDSKGGSGHGSVRYNS